MKRFLFPLLFAVASYSSVAHAASLITVSFDSGVQTLLNNVGVSLSGGSASIDGDGAVLQLGYFSNASAGNNFSGTWIPLTGEGSLNTGIIPTSSPAEPYNKTSIGDLASQGAGNGQFAISLNFTVGDATTGNSLPSSTTIPLSIRFYSAGTITGSGFYNTVSDNAWLWQTPAPVPSSPTVSMSLDQTGLVWEGGAGSALKTTLAVTPEPATAGIALIGGITMLIRRRRLS